MTHTSKSGICFTGVSSSLTHFDLKLSAFLVLMLSFILTAELFHKFLPDARRSTVLDLFKISHPKESTKKRNTVGKGFSKRDVR